MKEKKKDVKPGSNPKVEWHGEEGEHGTHNGPRKGDVYATIEPELGAHHLAEPVGHDSPGTGKGHYSK